MCKKILREILLVFLFIINFSFLSFQFQQLVFRCNIRILDKPCVVVFVHDILDIQPKLQLPLWSLLNFSYFFLLLILYALELLFYPPIFNLPYFGSLFYLKHYIYIFCCCQQKFCYFVSLTQSLAITSSSFVGMR